MPAENTKFTREGWRLIVKRKMRMLPSTEMGTTEFKISLISEHAKRDKAMRFTSLAHLLNKPFLGRCFNGLNRKKALGQDKVSWHDYAENLEENLESLVERLKRKSYRPIPARRVYIPKGDGKFRPLGISAIENKIVERAITLILQGIYEQDFSDMSFAFRPNLSCHHALKVLNDLIMFYPVNQIVEADIRGFFDNVDHEIMMKALRVRVADSSLLYLIERFLKAGYIDDGLLVRTDMGTPQGSILSPILSNIFLHYVLDKWFEEQVKPHVTGFCEIVRYADDFVCVAQFESDAKKIEKAVKNRFNRFKLDIHPEKSKRFSFGRFESKNAQRQKRKANTFVFLGFTHFCDRTRDGRFKLGRKTSRKKFGAKCRDMNQWLKEVRNQKKTKEWWGDLASKLRGHYQYYGVSGNYRAISTFYHRVREMLHKWLNRRSQKNKMSWERFNEYLRHYPLPTPSIKRNFYTPNSCYVK